MFMGIRVTYDDSFDTAEREHMLDGCRSPYDCSYYLCIDDVSLHVNLILDEMSMDG